MTLTEKINSNPYLKVSNCTDIADLEAAMDDLRKLDAEFGEDNKTLLKLWAKFLDKKKKLEAKTSANQIKLADGTNTTFDNNNPDIRFYEGGDINNKKQQLNKDMEYNNYAKGGKILGNVIFNKQNQPIGFNHQEQQKYARIGVTDKYKIEAFITMGIQGVNFDSDSLEEKLKNEVENLYATYTDYVISEDSKGIDAFFLADIRQAEIQQEPTSVVDQIKENQQNPQKRLEKVNQLAESQKYTLQSWIYYFKDGLYSNEFIYLMFSAILKFNYNLKKEDSMSKLLNSIVFQTKIFYLFFLQVY
jgi:hypothetical protein